jgi:creatinine amidohydrolase
MAVKKVLWETLRRTEFAHFVESDAVVILPVGSMEQHGTHLPINTDTNCCYRIAVAAAQSAEDIPVLVLPPVWCGYSPHHMTLEHGEGSLTLSYQTFANLLSDLAASVYAHGFRKILLLNGHGGNKPLIESIRLKLWEEKRIPSVHGFTYWELPGVQEVMRSISVTDKGLIGHSGEFETSLQLFLQPEFVDAKSAAWTSGVQGDPSVGTSEKGKIVFEASVEALRELLKHYHSGEYDDERNWRKDI